MSVVHKGFGNSIALVDLEKVQTRQMTKYGIGIVCDIPNLTLPSALATAFGS